MSKYEDLVKTLSSYGSVAIAFSGGVDSSLLLYAASKALGEKAIAVTVFSAFIPEREMKESKEFCENLGIKQVVLEVDTLGIPGISDNPKDRCYICKKNIFRQIKAAAAEYGIETVAEGSNTDDMGDYRPGMRAIEELNVKSPLKEAGLSKADIRELSKEFGLPTWDKPSFACLASRFVYGEQLTAPKLSMVEKAEELLRGLGFKQFRVRIHGNENFLARIELPGADIDGAMGADTRKKISDRLKELGFAYVTIDLDGYRTGSMNVGV